MLRIKPFSAAAFAVAAFALLCGAAFQALIVWTSGTGIPFAGFFPAIVVSTIIAGVPCGLLVAISSLVIVVTAVTTGEFDWHALTPERSMQVVWLLFSALVLVGFGSLCRDLLKRANDRLIANRVIVEEAQHRIANTVAIIEALTRHTLKDSPELSSVLTGRLKAVMKAADLLRRHPTGISLNELLQDHLGAIAGERITLQGPDVDLAPDQIRYLLLITHELLTNALKYGALSNSDGRVELDWEKDGQSLVVRWRENGGPSPSGSKNVGVGTQLIARCVAAVGASHNVVFEAEGLKSELRLPLRS